jgi:AcrR family transcriptional regulator
MAVPDTRQDILDIAFDILGTQGLDALSFDAISARLGKSKQAVLYWFPAKQDLLAAMFLPSLRAEADAACAALDGPEDESEAISAFVRAVTAFHRADLSRFRMMYLAPQTIRPGTHPRADSLLKEVHPVTDRLYQALAAKLNGPPDTRRARALIIHSAVLGLVLMLALADRLDDPLKHPRDVLVDALIAALTQTP